MSHDPVVGRQPEPGGEDGAAPVGQAVVRAGDVEREATVTRLQTAIGEGRIDLEEFGERAAAAYAAATTAALDQWLAALPAPVSAVPAVGEVIRERTTGPVFSVLGD